MTKIHVATEFSPTPIGRYKWQGRHSGEAFREVLKDRLRQSRVVEIDLSGTSGLSTGFLDEAFAGLIRENIISPQDYDLRISVVCRDDPSVLDTIHKYVSEAKGKIS
jgi:hypothetical protein